MCVQRFFLWMLLKTRGKKKTRSETDEKNPTPKNQKQRKKRFEQIQSHSIVNIFEVLIQIITSWTSEDRICVKQNLTTWFWHSSALYLCANSYLDVSTSSTVPTIFSLKLSFLGILNKVHWVKYKDNCCSDAQVSCNIWSCLW